MHDDALPTGTVTFLFSDIESSTRMVYEHGEVWPQVLEQQRAICRHAWTAHHGHELGTEGDSFLVAFADAAHAVRAATAAQQKLHAATWPDGVRVRVRMGLHTGTPQRHAEGYVGLDVHKGARVAAAAHGGQVLVSEATAALAQGVGELLDLGEHRLKDIPDRVRLLQVLVPGLPQDFPAPRSQGAPGRLPATTGEPVGREEELDELAGELHRGARLVTLTGPGGVGKTTLATELARRVGEEFYDGVWFVPMAAVTEATQMWSAIAQVLDVPADGQVPPGFFDHVRGRRLLLVLDNLEQVPDADDTVRRLLDEVPTLCIVATSRRPLHVPGEVEFAVAPLPTEPDSAAVHLFAQVAGRVRRGFRVTPDNEADVVALCRALDGLPLAIEIAAARTKLLAPAAILQRIDSALDVASADRGRDSRQRTMRQAIAWSYDLLPAEHQRVVDDLGAFSGGASLEALEYVVGDLDADLVDVLFELVDASLVRVADSDDGDPRFALLETVRRFALDRLERTGRLDAVAAAHATYFHDLVAGPLVEHFERDVRAGREVFLREFDNLAVVVARGGRGVRSEPYPGPVPPQHVVRVMAVAPLLYRRYHDALAWVDHGLDLDDADPLGTAALLAARVRLLRTLGRGASALADVDAARGALAAVAPGTAAGPLVVVARTTANLAFDAGQIHAAAGDRLAADAEVQRALEAAGDDDYLQAQALTLAMMVSYFTGDIDGARAATLELVELDARGVGSPLTAALRQNDLADFDLQQGRIADARRRLAAAAEQFVAVGDPETLVLAALTFAAAIATADPLLCARAYGAIHHAQVVEGLPNDEHADEEDARVMAESRAALGDDAAWDAAYADGAAVPVADVVREMAALPLPG